MTCDPTPFKLVTGDPTQLKLVTGDPVPFLIQLGLLRALELRKRSISVFKLIFMPIFLANFGNTRTLLAIFAPYFHCVCAVTAIYALSDTALEFSEPSFL